MRRTTSETAPLTGKRSATPIFWRGPRGYVVSVPVGECASVVKKLAEKVDLSGASEITYAEILLGEDEF